MKKNFYSFLAAALLLTAGSAKGQTLIHYWSFNNYDTSITLPDVAHIPATYSRINANNAIVSFETIPGTSAAYSTYLDTLTGDVLNARNGEAAGNAIRTRNPSDSMELLFSFPTTNYKNIVLKYETERSSSSHGALSQLFDYSVNGGSSWSTAGITVNGVAIDTYATTIAWDLVTVGLTDASVNNTSSVIFRMKFNGNTTTTTGNNRFDNLTVEGDTMTVNSVNQILGTQTILYPNPTASIVNISTVTAGVKTIAIVDMAGNVVYKTTLSGKSIHIDVASLQPGIYFIDLTEDNKTQKLRFIKE